MTNRNVQTNRHGPQNKGCNQASVDSKHYLVSKLPPPWKLRSGTSKTSFKPSTDVLLTISRWYFCWIFFSFVSSVFYKVSFLWCCFTSVNSYLVPWKLVFLDCDLSCLSSYLLNLNNIKKDKQKKNIRKTSFICMQNLI